jgi:Flp pilus assembly pilin Flp
MIAASEPKGGAATPRHIRRFFRRDQAHRQLDQSALSAPRSIDPPRFPLGKFARDRVRIDQRKEVTQMLKFFTFVQIAADSLRKREEGQTMAEYGVVLAVITLAVIGAITLLSDNVRAAIENVAGILPG